MGDLEDGASDPLAGALITDRYRVLKRLGEGGMGAVYLGEHLTLRKRVALKFLHPELSRVPEVVARFTREAIAAAALDHPNIVAAHDFGQTPDGRFFLVLDYVDGGSLRDLVGEVGALPPERALHVARHVASALTKAHSLGIVHRDLKPENIMLVERDGERDFAKVIDFGIAKVPPSQPGEAPTALTQAGLIMGTPEYMAPEQCLGGAVDARADLYAFAVVVFEMLTGRRPYTEDDAMTLLARHLSAPIPSVRERGSASLPLALDPVFERALAKSPLQRYEGAKAFVDALALALATPDPAPREAPEALADTGVLSVGYHATPRLDDGPESASQKTTPGTPRALAAVLPVASETLSSGRFSARVRGLVGRGRAWVEADPKRARRTGAVALAVLVLSSLVVASGRGPAVTSSSETSVAPRATTLATPPSRPAPAVPDRPLEESELGLPAPLVERVERFRQRPEVAPLVDSGAGGGRSRVTALRALGEGHPRDPVALYVVGLTLARLRAPGEAVAHLAWALEGERAFARDPALVGQVVRLYTAAREPPEGAEALLRGPLARASFHRLVAVAAGRASGRARAAALLRSAPFDRWLDPTTSGLLALAEARTCEARREAVGDLGRVGDARALPYLTRINTGGGCGFLGLGQCNACLAGALPPAIRAIRAREGGSDGS